MSVAVPIRLAKDCSVLDNFIHRDAASPAARSLDNAVSEIQELEDKPALEILASREAEHQVSERLVPVQSGSETKDRNVEQPGNNIVRFQHHEDASDARPGPRTANPKGTDERPAEPHLESFASALDYVLQHLAEYEGGTDADRYLPLISTEFIVMVARFSMSCLICRC